MLKLFDPWFFLPDIRPRPLLWREGQTKPVDPVRGGGETERPREISKKYTRQKQIDRFGSYPSLRSSRLNSLYSLFIRMRVLCCSRMAGRDSLVAMPLTSACTRTAALTSRSRRLAVIRSLPNEKSNQPRGGLCFLVIFFCFCYCYHFYYFACHLTMCSMSLNVDHS